MQAEILRNVRHNFTVNILDAGFFGGALGFASYVAIVPLFIATLTDSTIIIGFMASMFAIGWQLPQLLTANYVAGLRRFKRLTLLMSFHERWPYLGLAVVAFSLPVLGKEVALILALILVIWQTFAGGFTATAWQSLISKIIPGHRRGTFYGLQSSAANLMMSICVILAGWVLVQFPSPQDFAICFLIAAVFMGISFVFLAQAREPEAEAPTNHRPGWGELARQSRSILRYDVNFRWFLAVRVLTQFAVVAVSFFTIFAVRRYNMDEQTVAAMASVMTLTQMAAAPLLGWSGDRWGHRRMITLGALVAALSALIAMTATNANALYIAFALSGITNSVLWTNIMTVTVDFGTVEERPYYIGLANTLIAPATLIAPLIGGALAETLGFEATFLFAAVSGLGAAFLLQFVMRDPKQKLAELQVATVPVGD